MENSFLIVLLSITFSASIILPAATMTIVKASKKRGFVNSSKTDNGSDHDQCENSVCANTAAKVLMNMDTRTEPCDNFYRFACGGFLEKAIVPKDETRITSFNLVNDKIQEQLRAIIEGPSLPDEFKPFQLPKKLFKSCIRKSAIEKRGLKPLLDKFKQLGGWPLLEGDTWNESAFDWKIFIPESRKMGYPVNYFLDFSVDIHPMDTAKRIIHVDQAHLGLSLKYLLKGIDNKIVQGYSKYMIDIAVILGADRTRAEKELEQSLAFEMKLANISIPDEKFRIMRFRTMKSLSESYPSIPWNEYFSQLFPPSTKVENYEIALVEVPDYVPELEKLLKTTDKRIQINYIMWRIAEESVDYLNDEIRRRELAFSALLHGKTERKSRSEECIDIVSERLPISVGALYIRKYSNEITKNSVTEMVSNIRSQFTQLLRDAKWMDNITTNSALEKAASMLSHIAYPDELLDDSKLEEFYGNLHISEDNYFQNILNLRLFNMEYSSKLLKEPVDKNDWVGHGNSAVVNAKYNRYENSFELPAGIIQRPFFNIDLPNYMNYGAIGTIIGHEITHGFDDNGRMNDKDGNVVNWWTNSTNDEYLKKTECIINQYSNYTDSEVGLKLNGELTGCENVADNGGIKTAYLAYKSWSAKHPPEKHLPGLEKYTPQQMFWISLANVWCSQYRKETLHDLITTDSHSPGEFRILGPLSNMPQFAEDFSCSEGSKMNPKEKCGVW